MILFPISIREQTGLMILFVISIRELKGDCIIQWEGIGNFVNQLILRQCVAVPHKRQPPKTCRISANILWS